jgi:hypothetical protein
VIAWRVDTSPANPSAADRLKAGFGFQHTHTHTHLDGVHASHEVVHRITRQRTGSRHRQSVSRGGAAQPHVRDGDLLVQPAGQPQQHTRRARGLRE